MPQNPVNAARDLRGGAEGAARKSQIETRWAFWSRAPRARLLPVTSSKTSRLAFVALLLVLPSCEATRRILELDFYDAPDSRIENLERLHNARTGHHYTVDFVGDFEQTLSRERRTIGGVTIGSMVMDEPSKHKPVALANPSESCLELISELLEFDSEDNPRLAAMQIAWAARIVDEDPSHLSRERAILGMTVHARRLKISGPVTLQIDAPRANADETAQLLTGLIKAWRNLRDGGGGIDELRNQVDEVAGTTFDLKGSRRVLTALSGLMASGEKGSPEFALLTDLLEDFQRRTIEFSLGRALNDRKGPASRVRAAVVSTCADAGGAAMLARFMTVLEAERQAGPERDAILVFRILDLISRYGFPQSFAGMSDERLAAVREGWYDLLIGFAVEDLEGRVRVKAMQALTKTSDGPGSLREEEWEEWYYTRVEERRLREGLPPTPLAVDPSDSTLPDASESGQAEDSGQ